MNICLNERERAELLKQDPKTRKRGGFQGLMVRLQERCAEDGSLELSQNDLRRIPMYAFKYDNGGWEDRLRSAFSRHLGPDLRG